MQPWPSLLLSDWVDTRETVHLWTQMIGKLKLLHCPFVNQWWEVGLSLTARGLSSGLIQLDGRSCEVAMDFVDRRLQILVSDGTARSIALEPRSVADFYAAFIGALAELEIPAAINPLPAELPDPTPFDQDTQHRAYDADAVLRWWQAMLSVERAIQRFRTGFSGKSSPVLFYWGGFDLNHTRFNGRSVTQPADADPIRSYAENEENIAVGFWPGSRDAPDPVLYAYVAPAPDGIAGMNVEPAEAHFVPALGEFVLPYQLARHSSDPEAMATAFFRSAYEGCAELADWDRSQLEGPTPVIS